LSALIFAQLSPEAGAELANRLPEPSPTDTSDERIG